MYKTNHKKCSLISLRVCLRSSLSLWPVSCDLLRLKNESFAIMYLLLRIIYVSLRSIALLRSARRGNKNVSFTQLFAPFCVFSRDSLSFFSHGLHAGEQYSNIDRISVVYREIITSGDRFERNRFIIASH